MLGNMKLLGLMDLVNSFQSQRSERPQGPQGSITCLTWEEPDRIPGNAFLKVAEGFFLKKKETIRMSPGITTGGRSHTA